MSVRLPVRPACTHSDPRMSNIRVVVEVDDVASPPSVKVVPAATKPSVGVCSRLLVLTPVSSC